MFRTVSVVVLILATCLALLAAPVSADPPAQQSPTGFSISSAAFQDYYDHRGGVNTFGYPISREFTLLGTRVQFFQRGVMQLRLDGGVGLMNILDQGLLPYTQMNGSAFPAPDPAVTDAAPSPSDPNYGNLSVLFVKAYAPDEWEGMSVNFFSTFNSTVSLQDAFPNGEGDEGLLPLIDLEIWGLPTSKPTLDPSNNNFVYLRFQRGIMQYDKTTGLTQGILIGDYLKSVITGQNLPLDLANQAKGSSLYLQYNNSMVGGVNRPADLPGTDLFAAFEPDGVVVPAPPILPPPTATAVPTATPVAPPPTPTPVPAATIPPGTTPVITGKITVVSMTPWWLDQTNKALDLMARKSPGYYQVVQNNVARIQEVVGTSSYDVASRTLYVNEAAAFPSNWRFNSDNQVEWYAGLILHNATLIEQALKGADPRSHDAEIVALTRQRDLMAQIETDTNPGGQLYNFLTDVIEGREAVFGDWDPPRDPISTSPTATPVP